MQNKDLHSASAGFDQVSAAAEIIRDRLSLGSLKNGRAVGIVLGSGLGSFAESLVSHCEAKAIAYEAISHFPLTSVEGHKGQLVFGHIDNTPVFALQGRVHYYEGFSLEQVVFGVRVLLELGVQNLILTHAAGGIASELNAGDLMLIKDHINFTGNNPLVGSGSLAFGKRFVDLGKTYDEGLRTLAKKVANGLNIELKEGVCGCMLGPSYETPAEVRMLRTLGCDSVGMSPVYEAIAARQQNARVLGISCITNKAAGLTKTEITHEEVSDVSAQISDKFSALLRALIPKLANF